MLPRIAIAQVARHSGVLGLSHDPQPYLSCLVPELSVFECVFGAFGDIFRFRK
jgi:hypothetical protein